MDTEALIRRLDETVDFGWSQIHADDYWTHVMSNGMNRDVYISTLAQIYHYARHNSINQAFAAWRVSPEDMALLRFCYRHADDELGHEKMIVHDLQSIGAPVDETLAVAPLPATQALIGYLYYVGLQYGAVARLGYSYWAETSYGHIIELMQRAKQDLGLEDTQMAFLVAHQGIDVKHAEQVRQAVRQFVITEEQAQAVCDVASTSLYLTGQILDCVLKSFQPQVA